MSGRVITPYPYAEEIAAQHLRKRDEGTARERERAMGGATRFVLAHVHVALLLAH